jgi:diguanylate cyclase (GGDEF)-like protein
VYSRSSERLAGALDRIAIDSIRETLCCEPIARLSSDPNWLQFIRASGDFPFHYYRAVPIVRNMRLTGMIVSLLTEAGPDSRTDEKLLESWGQFASLAVERRGLYEQLSFRAQHDSLTALLNRASLYDHLDSQICRASAEGCGMAVIYLDLDHFKEINDRYGHGTGDQVLQHVSRRILASVRHTDIAARIGGDEFIVILPGVGDRKEAARVADLMVNAIGQPDLNGPQVRTGASFGVSIYPEDGADTDTLLKMADEDMYRAKLKRRSCPPEQGRTWENSSAAPSSAALIGLAG